MSLNISCLTTSFISLLARTYPVNGTFTAPQHDLYSAVLGQSFQVDALVRKLHNQVQREVDRAQQAWQTEGMLQMLMAT